MAPARSGRITTHQFEYRVYRDECMVALVPSTHALRLVSGLTCSSHVQRRWWTITLH